MNTDIDLIKAAELLGYERISWNDSANCYSGYGSSDPVDRSRDDADGYFIACNDDELRMIVQQS